MSATALRVSVCELALEPRGVHVEHLDPRVTIGELTTETRNLGSQGLGAFVAMSHRGCHIRIAL